MQKRMILICGLLSLAWSLSAQMFVDKAQIFEKLKEKFSPEAYAKACDDFEQANDTLKAIMLNVYSMPMTSRREAIENYEAHAAEIKNLQDAFLKAVPKGYVVDLTIELEDNALRSVKSVSLMISKKDKDGKLQLVDGEFDMDYGSERLDQLLRILKWDPMTFSNFRYMMQMADCYSIENSDPVEIGFKRSGLGKYSYLIFPTDILTVPQIKKYNDGCEYKYYKKNIVIKYEGGMAGPQCFTD